MEVYPQQRQQIPQHHEEEYEDNRGMPHLQDPYQGSHAINQDQSFMKWLFDFRKEVISPLRHVWRGHEYDHSKQEWLIPKNGYPIMNEKGVTWCISFIESYISPVFIVSNFDSVFMNYTMREATRVIWNKLSLEWKEFGLKKIDIPRVANEIESKILAIILGARGDGYRTFFSKQYHVQESINNFPQQGGRSGVLSSMMNMFRPGKLNETI